LPRAIRDAQHADVKLPTILAAIAASVVLAGCGTTTATQGSSGSSAAQAAPGIGAPVRDGKFEFVVLEVDRSKTAGPTDDQSTAQGEFINVHLSVKNTGNEAQGYYATNQKLIINGKKFDAASIMGAPGDGNNINPGLGIDSTVVSFDVPVGAAPDAIELHDSAFSGGVKVSLAGSPPASNG
jgi:hypothetical protein